MKNTIARGFSKPSFGSRFIGVFLLALAGCSADVETIGRGDVLDDGEIGVVESALGNGNGKGKGNGNGNSNKPQIGDGSVLATIPTPPGWPEGLVIVGDRLYVSGPATFGTAGLPPSKVLVFDVKTGAPKGSITIQGEQTEFEHALSCITADADGRLYVLSTQLGVVRLTRSGNGWVQDIYSPLPPDLPMCTPDSTGPCSPTPFDGPPLVNDLAFDRDGNLYITDSFQATIFRVPRGGGPATIWFQSPELAGIPFYIGLNGLAFSRDQKQVYVTVTAPAQNPAVGRLYAIRRVASPSSQDLTLVHEFQPGDEPDGIAVGVTGDLYVALTASNAVSVIGRNGNEIRRLTGPNGSPIPYDGPASIVFDGKGSILVTNHAPLTNNTDNFAILKQYVGDRGFPFPRPRRL